eukprot:gene11454-15345_t
MIILSFYFSTFVFAKLIQGSDLRPAFEDRTFHSTAIDNLIQSLTPLLIDNIQELFTNCLPNTLDTTVFKHTQDPITNEFDSFIITGDIEALWLRDSANQVIPYLPYAPDDPK